MNRVATGINSVVEMKNLTVGYGIKEVLTGIQANISRGQFVSLLGPNGVGKTTLLRTLSRHLQKIEGNIFINDRPIESYGQRELACNLAVVLTSRINTELFTGFEFTAMGRHPHTGFLGALADRDREKVWEALRLVNAVNLAERQMDQLSDGEKQKLFIARALAQEPKIIILDEPTAHLDLKHQMEIMAILRDSCREKGLTIIVSLHDVGVAARVSDQVALIKDGAVVAWGRPEEVLTGTNVSELYDIDGAVYDRTIGTLEMKGNPGTRKVFCVSGAGTGATLFRFLSKNGINIATGVLNDNDVDHHVANALGAHIISAPAFEQITEEMISNCAGPIREADYVIDTGFPVRAANRMNTELITYALAQGKPVFTLRKAEDAGRLLKTDSGNLVACQSEVQLLDKLGAMVTTQEPGVRGQGSGVRSQGSGV